MATDRPRRPSDPFAAAEAAFKTPAQRIAQEAPKPSFVPNAKELVSFRIDQEVLHYFQQGGPGWQERINEALRHAMKTAG